MKNKILCIEDDKTTQQIVKHALADYNVIMASTLLEAEDKIKGSELSAAIFDIKLPDGDGIHLYSRLRQLTQLKNIPVIFLSGNDDLSNKLLAFSIGADDFISKPFDPLELSARITSRINKNYISDTERKTRQLSDLMIDLDRQKVLLLKDNTEIDLQLTAIEQRILILLSSRKEQVFSREQILNHVWKDAHVFDRTVDSHIAHIRNKIKNTGVKIATVKNFGYKLTINDIEKGE